MKQSRMEKLSQRSVLLKDEVGTFDVDYNQMYIALSLKNLKSFSTVL